MRFPSFCLCVSARSFRIRYLFHIRIGNVTKGNEGLLDGLRRCPTDYVMRPTCLIVSTGFTTTTKRLLSHNRSRGLIIDVEIAGSCFKLFQSAVNKFSAMWHCYCNKELWLIVILCYYLLILTINSASQCKRSWCTNQLHRLIQICIFVYINW